MSLKARSSVLDTKLATLWLARLLVCLLWLVNVADSFLSVHSFVRLLALVS